ncbi:MAG: CaiB/BaiF CoA-transferase family protein, partial [Halomonas sp.]
DIFTGLYAANGILAALYARDKQDAANREGTHIDMALMDVQVGVLANQALNYLTSGNVPQRLGNAHPNIVPYQAFDTADGYMILAVGNDGQFQRLCAVLERPELAQDERFATNDARVSHREQLIPELQAVLATRGSDKWLAALESVGVPAGPVNTLDRVFDDPHVRARELKQPLTHPQSANGKVDLVNNPIRFNGVQMSAQTAPPTLGEHTDSVLKEQLGLDNTQIEGLKALGIL